MEDRGCTAEMLKRLYVDENKTQEEIKLLFGIKDSKVLNRWFEESGIKKRSERGRYSFNKNFFDNIDTEEKAYWLGFIWCDAYVCKRIRNGKLREYQIKISLSEKDEDHLYKLKESLNAKHPIRRYSLGKKAFKSKYQESRLMISNIYMGDVLYDKYGMIPNRHSVDRLIKYIPEKLERHFIRGVFDAEGSTSMYLHQIKEEWNPSLKMNFTIYTYKELNEYIQAHLIKNGIKDNEVKTYRRHEDRDGHCVGLRYAGATQVPKILRYLYHDANIYLERKYQKYLEIEQAIMKRGGVNIEI